MTSGQRCEFVVRGTRCVERGATFEDRLLCDEHRAYVEDQRRHLLALHDAGRRRALRPADVYAVLVDLERDLARLQQERRARHDQSS